MSMTWTCRELQSITKGNDTYSYSYNINGLRTKKSVNGNNTFYYYDDSNNLIGLKKGNTTVLFYYDSEGQLYSMSKGEDTYFFIKSLWGDIRKIIDENGTEVAWYSYDPFGKIIVGREDSSVEGLNPFRYRGYVYDEETELYYLQSRYYDPKTCRFINADAPEFSDTGSGTPLSTNMFAYCENNPISGYDPSGEDAWWIQATGSAKSFGHTSLLIQERNGFWWYLYWGEKSIQMFFIGKSSPNSINKTVGKIIKKFNKEFNLKISYTDTYNGGKKYIGSFYYSFFSFKTGMSEYSYKYSKKIYMLKYNPNKGKKGSNDYYFYNGKYYICPYSWLIVGNKCYTTNNKNCLRISVATLLQGKLTKNDKKFKEQLWYIFYGSLIPNNAYNYMKYYSKVIYI